MVPKEKLIELLNVMMRTKMLEERAIKLFQEGHSPGWVHPGRGEEAVGAGVMVALRPDDVVYPTHRGRAPAVARGLNFKEALAELYGKATGISMGRSGYDFMAGTKFNVYPFVGSIGATPPMATGTAMSFRIQKSDRVAVVFFGDGAANHGTFHESLNVGAKWKLPILYVCQNNGWAQFTPQEKVTSVVDVYKKAAGYGMPGLVVDGNDAVAVYEAALPAIERARSGQGPTLLECKTRRWFGHYVGDPQRYRDKAEMDQVPLLDPIPRLAARLVKEKVLTQAEVDRMEADITAELDEAQKYAAESPFPAPETAFQHVYKETR